MCCLICSSQLAMRAQGADEERSFAVARQTSERVALGLGEIKGPMMAGLLLFSTYSGRTGGSLAQSTADSGVLVTRERMLSVLPSPIMSARMPPLVGGGGSRSVLAQ